MELYEIIKKVVAEGIIKLTISKPRATAQFKKITVSKKDSDYFAEQFTEKQVFHKNIKEKELLEYLSETVADYLQLNVWTVGTEHIVLISKKRTYFI